MFVETPSNSTGKSNTNNSNNSNHNLSAVKTNAEASEISLYYGPSSSDFDLAHALLGEGKKVVEVCKDVPVPLRQEKPPDLLSW